MDKLNNTRIGRTIPVPTPDTIKKQYPIGDAEAGVVLRSRRVIERILHGHDHRILVVVGPCSFHDVETLFRYARQLARLAGRLANLHVVMRFCGDKPRTGLGWPGFWSDPGMDGRYDFAYGWTESRRLALRILGLGLPLGCEYLDPALYQYTDDLMAYAWIGARDVGSTKMRKRASALSVPVGLKNHPSGGVEVAIEGLKVAVRKNFFVDPDDTYALTRFESIGNRMAHLIHRGVDAGPNYSRENVMESARMLANAGMLERVMIDVSHGNTLVQDSEDSKKWKKDYTRQVPAIKDVTRQIVDGGPIAGILCESFLKEGKQSIPEDLRQLDRSQLRLDQSVTDGCLGWETTEETLVWMNDRLSRRKKHRKA